MTYKVLKLFVNILAANDKYSLLDTHNLRQPIQIQLSQTQKGFPEFVATFLKARLNVEHPETNFILTADVFSILRTPKNMVKQIYIESTFAGSFEREHVKGDFGNFTDTTFNIFIDPCEGSSVGKILS